MKEKIKNICKRIFLNLTNYCERHKVLFVIACFLIIFNSCSKFYAEVIHTYNAAMYGKFQPMAGRGNIVANESMKIFKEGNIYLFVDEVYGAATYAEYDSENKKLINVREITNELERFKKAFQLNNNNVVFYRTFIDTEKHPLTFLIYDIRAGEVISKVDMPIKVNSWNINNVWSVNESDFIIDICDKEKCSLYLYEDNKGKIKEIKNPFGYNDRYREVVKLDNNTYITAFGGEDKTTDEAISRFVPKDNSFIKIDQTELDKFLKEEAGDRLFMEHKIIPLSENRFLLVGVKDSYQIKKIINVFALFEINDDKVKKIFSKEFHNLKINLSKSGYKEVSKNKILIAGSEETKIFIITPRFECRKEAYQLDLEKQRIKKINDMGYYGAHMKFIDLDQKTILMYSRYGGVGSFKLFKKGLLW